jgi:hypothetical protein
MTTRDVVKGHRRVPANYGHADTEIPKEILPPSFYMCRWWCACHKLDSIYRKYVQYLLSPNKFIKKTRFKDLFNDTNYVL